MSFSKRRGRDHLDPTSTVVHKSDMAELRRHYKFVPTVAEGSSRENSTWQERMVQHYHQHLYKEYVLADLKFVEEEKLGLRWRTKQEVASGKGSSSCGNKHCPSHSPSSIRKLHASIGNCKPRSDEEIEERHRLSLLSYGDEQVDFEVPFSYQENNTSKMELVKLRLCAKCAPLLFISKSLVDPCLAAKKGARTVAGEDHQPEDEEISMPDGTQRSESQSKRKHKKSRKNY